VRRNGGGSSDFGLQVLSYLSKKPIGSAFSYTRSDNGFQRAQGGAVYWKPLTGNGETFEARRAQVFTGQVAVLIGPRTFSAGEDFVVSFEGMRRGVTIGEATGGSTGQPIVVALPGGGMSRICSKRDTYPDGRQFVGKGIAPDIVVAPTVASLRAGEDPVLKRAIEQLAAARVSAGAL
jgi:carboxyl-terminal processing protease